MVPANLRSRAPVALALAIAGLVGGCGGSTQTRELPTITAHPGTSASVEVSGQVTSGCGGAGGCAYFGRLSSAVKSSEASGLVAWTDWEFDTSGLPELRVSYDPFPAGMGPGTARVEARMHDVLGVDASDQRQLGRVAASCASDLTVPEGATRVVIRVTFNGTEPCRIETEVQPPS
jgi:hypothetical protein